MIDGYTKLNLIMGSEINREETINLILKQLSDVGIPLTKGYHIENYREIVIRPETDVIYGWLNMDNVITQDSDIYVRSETRGWLLPEELDVATIGYVKHRLENGFRKGTYTSIVCLKDVDEKRMIVKL